MMYLMLKWFVGKGLADGAAIGNVFASPSPDPIVEATKAISGGKGVVYMYGNYAGDIMNFDMAAEMCEMEGIPVKTILVTDDIASSLGLDETKGALISGVMPDGPAKLAGIKSGDVIIKFDNIGGEFSSITANISPDMIEVLIYKESILAGKEPFVE